MDLGICLEEITYNIRTHLLQENPYGNYPDPLAVYNSIVKSLEHSEDFGPCYFKESFSNPPVAYSGEVCLQHSCYEVH